jgi:hypothetical protein
VQPRALPCATGWTRWPHPAPIPDPITRPGAILARRPSQVRLLDVTQQLEQLAAEEELPPAKPAKVQVKGGRGGGVGSSTVR